MFAWLCVVPFIVSNLLSKCVSARLHNVKGLLVAYSFCFDVKGSVLMSVLCCHSCAAYMYFYSFCITNMSCITEIAVADKYIWTNGDQTGLTLDMFDSVRTCTCVSVCVLLCYGYTRSKFITFQRWWLMADTDHAGMCMPTQKHTCK